MTEAGETVAVAPVDRAIARIREVYRNWKRDTPVAQMRSDWDAAFEACTVPVRASAFPLEGSMLNGFRPAIRSKTRPFSISTAAAFAWAPWPRTAT